MRRSVSALLATGLVAAGTLGLSPLTANAAPNRTAPAATAATRDPVVIVGGTTAPAYYYGPMAGRLAADGYTPIVYALPGGGLQDIAATTADFAQFMDGVLATTGAEQVDLVGHSQGGLVAMDYVKRHGGDAVVDSIVTLGTPHKGTVVANKTKNDEDTPLAFQQMAMGSRYLWEISKQENKDVPAGVRVTTLRTSHDELVQPIGNASLKKGAVNVLVQDQCRSNTVSHVELPLSGVVYSGVRTALEGGPVTLDCDAF